MRERDSTTYIGPVMNTCKELPYEELNSIQVSTLHWTFAFRVLIVNVE
jgi:hypothetical protein